MQQFNSFAQMQRDAERRVMEMQKRAMAAVESSDPPPVIIPEPAHREQELGKGGSQSQSETPHESPETPDETQKNESPFNQLLPGLNLSEEDSERALLIAILLLIKGQADHNLIFLLLYLML